MNILAIETSSQACSVALSIDGVIAERHEILDNRHSDYLLAYIDALILDSCITKSDLDAIAIGTGPGSFTGLRLGMGVAHGLAYGLTIPLVPVPSLLAIAAQSVHDYLLVAVDARMGEIYWQCFERIGVMQFTPLTQANLDKPSEVVLPQVEGHWFGLGSGWDQYLQTLGPLLNNKSDWLANVLPRASTVAKLGQLMLKNQAVDLQQQVLPSYIRNKVTN